MRPLFKRVLLFCNHVLCDKVRDMYALLIFLRLVTATDPATDPYLTDITPWAWMHPTRPPIAVGVTSRFGGPDDKKYGGQALACSPTKHVDASMRVCAHRTYRCGTVLLVESVKTGKRTVCRVMDRGPYGAIDAEGVWHVEIKLQPGSTRRGILDMTPRGFNELGLTGLAPVRLWVLFRPATPFRIRAPQQPVRKPSGRRTNPQS